VLVSAAWRHLTSAAHWSASQSIFRPLSHTSRLRKPAYTAVTVRQWVDDAVRSKLHRKKYFLFGGVPICPYNMEQLRQILLFSDSYSDLVIKFLFNICFYSAQLTLPSTPEAIKYNCCCCCYCYNNTRLSQTTLGGGSVHCPRLLIGFINGAGPPRGGYRRYTVPGPVTRRGAHENMWHDIAVQVCFLENLIGDGGGKL